MTIFHHGFQEPLLSQKLCLVREMGPYFWIALSALGMRAISLPVHTMELAPMTVFTLMTLDFGVKVSEKTAHNAVRYANSSLAILLVTCI